MTTLPFYLGQVGLLSAAICSLMIMHLQAANPARPAWYYFVTVWLTAVGCAFVFSDPYISPGTGDSASLTESGHLPDVVYGLRFLFGLERLAIYLNYKTHWGKRLSPRFIRGVNLYFVGTSVAALLGLAAVGFYRTVEQNRRQTEQLERAATQNRQGVVRNTAEIDRLEQQVDSLTRLHRTDMSSIQWLTYHANQQGQQIDQLIRTVDLLRESVKRLSSRLDRAPRPQPYPPYLPQHRLSDQYQP